MPITIARQAVAVKAGRLHNPGVSHKLLSEAFVTQCFV